MKGDLLESRHLDLLLFDPTPSPPVEFAFAIMSSVTLGMCRDCSRSWTLAAVRVLDRLRRIGRSLIELVKVKVKVEVEGETCSSLL
jgi:hypothetical protein